VDEADDLICRPIWRRSRRALNCWLGYAHSGLTEWRPCNPAPEWQSPDDAVYLRPRPAFLELVEDGGTQVIVLDEEVIEGIEAHVGARHILQIVDEAIQDVVSFLEERCAERAGRDGWDGDDLGHRSPREVLLYVRGKLVGFELDPEIRDAFHLYAVDPDRDALPRDDAEALLLILSAYRDLLREREKPDVPHGVPPPRVLLRPLVVTGCLPVDEVRAGIRRIERRLRFGR
jgi:hypothetical protein